MMTYRTTLSGRKRCSSLAAVISVAAALFLGSCSGEGERTPADDSGSGGESAEAVAVAARQVSDVTFRTLDGEKKKISDFSGKILFVNYIETWNNDSKKLVPIMNELQYLRQQNVKVIGVITDRGAYAARTFIRDNDVKFEVLLADGDPGRFGAPSKLPTTHVVTRQGGLFHTFKGLQIEKQYDEFVIEMYRRRM
jgi:peroxiredoxin